MKTTKKIVMAVLAISLIACSGGGKLKPASKKINGPLGKFFEVVERDYKMYDNELSVEFKRIAEGGPTGASWSSEPTFTVELQDEDGNSVASEHTNVVFNKEQLESVFSLGVNETASITFRFNENKKKDAVKFKVSSKWDGAKDSDGMGLNLEDGYHVYEGLWHSVKHESQPCRITFEKKGDHLLNSTYTNLKYNASFPLRGSIKGDSLFFDGEIQGKPLIIHLSGNDNHLSGIGRDSAHSDQEVRVVLNRAGKGQVSDYEEADYDISIGDEGDISIGDEGDISFDSEGDSSFDELLDEYEKYYRTLISFGKKMQNNDPTAMVEYAKLLKRAKDCSEKIEKVKGKLSPSQLNRFNKINIEMAEEMQKIQSR